MELNTLQRTGLTPTTKCAGPVIHGVEVGSEGELAKVTAVATTLLGALRTGAASQTSALK